MQLWRDVFPVVIVSAACFFCTSHVLIERIAVYWNWMLCLLLKLCSATADLSICKSRMICLCSFSLTSTDNLFGRCKHDQIHKECFRRQEFSVPECPQLAVGNWKFS
jgi:hypothetical protein